MTNSPSSNLENNFVDERPLTALETPFEHHQEKEDSFVQSPEDETFLTNQTTRSDDQSFVIPSENGPNPMTLSSFLPDVIAETTEERQNHSIPPSVQSERESTEENPTNFTEEDFPPLPQPASQMPLKLNDEDYPPLPSVTPKPDLTTFDTLPEPEDVLGNKTLLKQVRKHFFHFHSENPFD